MTCRMAAGQQKRRLSNSNLHDPIKGKKKKRLDSSDYTLSLRPHVDLDWDERRKRVMPKKDQVGLAWKDLGPFVDMVPQRCKGLADVIQVPKEIFGLKDLTCVLSYEVWDSCLSESDKKLLSQFLPSGIGTGQAVESLLRGDNFHFGNQFTQWSASVCCGDMHPDAVRQKEKQFLSDKKAYYVELSNYHSSMIENLDRWKEKWMNCRDPEKLFRDTPTKHKPGSIASPPEKPKVNKKEVVQKIVRSSDTAKYMSYVKISRSQYEQVKNLKQSGEGFLPKLLTPVLGDIKSLNIKPYDSFIEHLAEEEEAEAEVQEPESLTEEHDSFTNTSSYRHDLERVPSLNSHHQDPTTPSEALHLIPVSTSSELIEQFSCDEIGQTSDPDKWVPVSDYSQQPSGYLQQGQSSLKLPELISRQCGGGIGAVIALEKNVMEMDNGASIFCHELIPSFQKEPEMPAPPYSHGSLNGTKQQVAGVPSFLLGSERPPESLQA